MTTDTVDVKAALTEGLTELRLPTVKRVYEESARLAERETLSYHPPKSLSQSGWKNSCPQREKYLTPINGA